MNRQHTPNLGSPMSRGGNINEDIISEVFNTQSKMVSKQAQVTENLYNRAAILRNKKSEMIKKNNEEVK